MRRLVIALAATTAIALAVLLPRLASATASGPAKAACTRTFERERMCTDAFIPALVDLRASLDKPSGITAEVAKAGGRAALITQALDEWKSDSTDEAIDSTCTRMVLTSKAAAMTSAADTCLSVPDCDGFVRCVIPLMAPHL